MNYSWKNGITLSPDPVADNAVTAKLSPEVRAIFEGNRPEDVEELLLGRIEKGPFDLRFLVPIIRHFVKNKKTETAETFFDLLLESCRNHDGGALELTLLRALLAVWPGSVAVRKTLLEHVRAFYVDCPNFKRLVEHCRITDAPEPLSAFRKLEGWLRYDEGRGVYMATKGVGRVREINCTLDAIRVVFPDSNVPLSFKPDEAARLLEPLPAGHFLLDKFEHPAELQQCAETDTGELLRRLFTSVNRQLPLAELRSMLAGIVDASQWSSWWTAARKDRRLTIGTGNVCCWNDSADDADSGILAQFSAAAVRDKIDMARKHAKRSPALAAAMADALVKEAESAADPALALELFLSLDKLPGLAAADQKKNVAALLRDKNASRFIRGIADRNTRKKALALVRELREDWHILYHELLTSENDAQLITLFYDSLRDGFPGPLEELVREVIASPSRAPDLFIWLCKEMFERPELQGLASWNFLQLIMQLLSNNAIKEHNAALRKLFDVEGTFHQAARKLGPEQATHLIALLERDNALEDYRRNRMLADLHAWYPQAQDAVDTTFFVTPESLALRQAEFTKITTVDIPQNTEEIMKARAHGDLRENFEYHAARARQEMLSSRAKTLHDELQFARPINVATVDPSVVCIGTSIRLVQVNGAEELTITVLGPWDSDPARHVYSYLAPAANALLGKKVGAEVAFNEQRYSIAAITVWKATIPHYS
jgi:transcription elongation factor GreA